jgi:aspartate 1-decarboxylase
VFWWIGKPNIRPNFAPLKMLIEVLKSKIHRATVTQTELDYVGSITIDENLLDAANMIEGEKVLVVNNNNGERIETYAIAGERGKGMICLNGAAARKAAKGDVVIIISFAHMEFEKAKSFVPSLVFPDKNNKPILE